MNGFEKCAYEHTLFVKSDKHDEFFLVCVYVDDLIYTGNSKHMIHEFKMCMLSKFKMTNLGKMHYLLGLEAR